MKNILNAIKAQFENTDSDDDDEEDDEIEFGQLKIVVGKVLDMMTHSHEDSHYVMKVDIGGHPAKYMVRLIFCYSDLPVKFHQVIIN